MMTKNKMLAVLLAMSVSFSENMHWQLLSPPFSQACWSSETKGKWGLERWGSGS